jgi:hypothetical protein
VRRNQITAVGLTSGIAMPVIISVCRHASELKVALSQFLWTKATIRHKGAILWIVTFRCVWNVTGGTLRPIVTFRCVWYVTGGTLRQIGTFRCVWYITGGTLRSIVFRSLM